MLLLLHTTHSGAWWTGAGCTPCFSPSGRCASSALYGSRSIRAPHHPHIRSYIASRSSKSHRVCCTGRRAQLASSSTSRAIAPYSCWAPRGYRVCCTGRRAQLASSSTSRAIAPYSCWAPRGYRVPAHHDGRMPVYAQLALMASTCCRLSVQETAAQMHQHAAVAVPVEAACPS